MNRRHAITGLLSLSASVKLTGVFGQSRKSKFRIGFLTHPDAAMRAVFIAEMVQLGFVEERDFSVIPSGSADAVDVVEAAKRLLVEKPDVIVTLGTARALAVHRQTKSIPIVMWTSGYPVEVGLARSLARPGGNVTGNTIYAGTEVWGKMVQLLHEARPGIKRVGVLWGYSPPRSMREEIEPPQREIANAGRILRVATHIAQYADPDEVLAALAELERAGSEGVIVAGRASLGPARRRVMQLALARRWATIADSQWPTTDEPYPLLTYGASFGVLMRQTAAYVSRILRGEDPGALPIQRPSKVDLVVSLRTAKLIGLAMPSSILLLADRVIE